MERIEVIEVMENCQHWEDQVNEVNEGNEVIEVIEVNKVKEDSENWSQTKYVKEIQWHLFGLRWRPSRTFRPVGLVQIYFLFVMDMQ